METTNNYIDELVKKAYPDKIPSADDAILWKRIDSTLKYKGFLKFSLKTFNVYYSASILVVAVFISSYFLTNNNTAETKINTKMQIQTAPNKSNIIQKAQEAPKTNEKQSSTLQSESKQMKQIEPKQNNKQLTVAIVDKTICNDSTNNNNNASAKKKKVKFVKKTIFITDTIHKKDTVLIRK